VSSLKAVKSAGLRNAVYGSYSYCGYLEKC
jgi:hypothetical protein